MMTVACDKVWDLLPDLLGQRLDARTEAAVRAHLQGCADCRAELSLVSAVASARLAVPTGLERRIQNAVRGRSLARPRWPIAAAAAVAAAMIGGSALLRGALERQTDTVAPAAVTDAQGAGWIGVDDAFMSGTSSLRDLSVEELEKLLVELDS
jgi:predicted anti-sigma-YlaC factor YlaD